MDVERFFPGAIAHLKAHPSSPEVAADKEARMWHDATHTLNADGFRPPEKVREDEDAADPAAAGGLHRSFFEEGSLDIRGGIRDAYRSGQSRGGDAPFSARPAPPLSRAERLSPDVLQLTGGKPRLHGAALASRSNAAPADQTLEPEEGNYMGKRGDQGSEFGDTPVQLTDMLRERLMELKGNRLREERNDAFMPRRLALKTDAEIAREREAARLAQEQSKLLLKLATSAAAVTARPARQTTTTLADLIEEDDAAAGFSSPSSHLPAIVRDGVSAKQKAVAADVLRRVHDYMPTSAGKDAEEALADLDAPFGRGALGGGEEERESGAVYLLRVLPRASFCSRREASALVASGQVRVNNVTERNPFRLVRPEDDVHISGHQSRLRFAPTRLWMYNKPANVIVSRNDVSGRTLIGKHARILGMDHLIPVGSLPMRAHGILLVTNDGELSRYLENPRANIQQTYLLRVRPAVDAVLAHKLNTDGININGRQYKGAMEFMVNAAAKSRYSLKVKVRGETMPISHLMQHLGRKIERGGRMSFGPFALSTLPVGSMREVTVPTFYSEHAGSVWAPFVERDWPYFRRQRVSRLRRLCRYRELTPRELEELDDYTYEELHDALRFDEQELAAAAEARGEAALAHRPSFFSGQAIPNDFPHMGGAGQRVRMPPGGEDVSTLESTEWAESGDEIVIEDITSLV